MKQPYLRTVVCIFLVSLLAFPMPAFAAAANRCDCGHSPVIQLQGYSGTQLFLDVGTPDEQQIWAPQLNGTAVRSLADVLLSVLPELLKTAGGDIDKAVESFGGATFLLEKMHTNDDGSPKYNVTPKFTGAHESRWDVMKANGYEKLNTQRPTTNSLAEATPDDHIYIFQNDWRLGQMEGAKNLHKFIEEVKADSGHDTVSLFGYSYGGQLAVVYLTYYGGAGIDRVVLHSPAVLGSQLTVDLLEKNNFSFDLVAALDLVAVIIERELSLSQRLAGTTIAQLNELAVRVVRTYLKPMCLTFGSFWDLIPPDQYDRMKAKYLDPVKNAKLIERSDKIHYEVMPKAGETLRYWQKKGVKIAAIVGIGQPLISGTGVDSDLIIQTSSTAGAAALPMDSKKVIAKPAGTVCNNPNHRHISPDGHVDASCAFLPETTWFFRGQYHGQACWDLYAKDIYNKWLTTDEIKDVYSNPEYPQFRDSCNPSDGLEARFSASVSGYLTAKDDTLLLKNLSEYSVSLLSVQADGLDLDIPMLSRIDIAPGQTARLRYETILPQKQTRFSLTVNYIRESPLPMKESRTFRFSTLPSNEKVPAFLRGPALPQNPAAPTSNIRLGRTALNIGSLALSLMFATLCVGVMYRGAIAQAKRKKKPAAG